MVSYCVRWAAQLSLTTMMAGLLNAAATNGRSGYEFQEPGVNEVTGVSSPSVKVLKSPGSHNSQPVSPDKPQKARRLTGNLIDAGCMSIALRQAPSFDETLFPDPLAGFWQTLQSSQLAEQERNARERSPQGQPQTLSRSAWTGESDGEPNASEQQIAMQTAQLKRARMLEQVTKACTPNPSSQHYGLVVSGGRFLRFDTVGDSKARDAINASPIEPGKTLKVKVTGVIEALDTLRVASIEIKGRIPAPRVSSGR